ncbi:MAG: hypothetical protein RLZ45_3261 [Verrucomicrobiota bacterium]|jgi:hypothetical protein
MMANGCIHEHPACRRAWTCLQAIPAEPVRHLDTATEAGLGTHAPTWDQQIGGFEMSR